jgi:Zn-dependent peptidase ImmA (M78 family)
MPAGVEGTAAERIADRFAGAFLVPRESLVREIGPKRSQISVGELVALKQVYGVSATMLSYRLRDLEIISTVTFRGLWRDFAHRGWTKPPYEPSQVDEPMPRRFERLCLRAIAENMVSLSKAAELLGCTVEALHLKLNPSAAP